MLTPGSISLIPGVSAPPRAAAATVKIQMVLLFMGVPRSPLMLENLLPPKQNRPFLTLGKK
jgi:hypothetical protein